MYIPKRYRIEINEKIMSFMKSNPFGLLVTSDCQKPIATHVPLEIREVEDKLYITGHLAYGNPQKKTLENNSDVLVIFQGPHAYISSSWYENENVPTWNYTAVHAYGKSRIMAVTELNDSLTAMLEHYESGRPSGRLRDTFTAGFFEQQMNGIVGFEVEITSIEAAFKMSQNRNDVDYRHIVNELEKSADASDKQVGELMRQIRPDLFETERRG